MAQRYRLTRINPSNGPRNAKESDYSLQNPYEVQPLGMAHRSSGHLWRWAFFGLITAVVIIAAAAWMFSVSRSLTHLNQAAQQNAASLVHQAVQLADIQTQLQQLNQHLSQISQQLTTFFRHVMQAIQSGKL